MGSTLKAMQMFKLFREFPWHPNSTERGCSSSGEGSGQSPLKVAQEASDGTVQILVSGLVASPAATKRSNLFVVTCQ